LDSYGNNTKLNHPSLSYYVGFLPVTAAMSFIAQLQPQLKALPETLRATVASSLQHWHDAVANIELPINISDSLVKVWASS
jgi:D-aminopeptidase